MKVIRLFNVELKRYLHEMKAYFPDHIVNIFVSFLLFIIFFLGMSKGDNEFLYIGFFYWFFANSVIGESSASISDEKQSGTFEQLIIKPTRLLSILSMRTFIMILISLIKAIVLIPLIVLILRINFVFDFRIIFLLLITLVGVFGFGLLLATLTLVFTKTASFESIISYLLLFISGAIIPYQNLPNWLYIVSKFLPISQGISVSVSLLSTNTISTVDLILLIINSLSYCAIGIIVFVLVQKRGKKTGFTLTY
jgi:ABC-2 type transport system permease protein